MRMIESTHRVNVLKKLAFPMLGLATGICVAIS